MALVIDLIRHGEAESAAASGDAERVLSRSGTAAVRALARALAGRAWRPTRVLSSPLRRARETAEILVREAALECPTGVLAALLPDRAAADVLEALAAAGMEDGHLVLISHMPLLGMLSGTLADEPLSFAPAQMVRIECQDGLRPGGGTLVFTLDPRAG